MVFDRGRALPPCRLENESTGKRHTTWCHGAGRNSSASFTKQVCNRRSSRGDQRRNFSATARTGKFIERRKSGSSNSCGTSTNSPGTRQATPWTSRRAGFAPITAWTATCRVQGLSTGGGNASRSRFLARTPRAPCGSGSCRDYAGNARSAKFAWPLRRSGFGLAPYSIGDELPAIARFSSDAAGRCGQSPCRSRRLGADGLGHDNLLLCRAVPDAACGHSQFASRRLLQPKRGIDPAEVGGTPGHTGIARLKVFRGPLRGALAADGRGRSALRTFPDRCVTACFERLANRVPKRNLRAMARISNLLSLLQLTSIYWPLTPFNHHF
jgi:hypothetical protein